ncbi:MAG: HAD family hydrolase [Planctomycetota bacterium]|jgi:hypothetical protein
MRALADQYRRARQRYPDDELVIVFDIDGTIIDMRHVVRHVLLDYDRRHGTRFFYGLRLEDITDHESRVEPLLRRLEIPEASVEVIHEWYLQHRWTPEAILASHEPFQGVLDIIRWFQLQPHTHVGLNTGRPEALRRETLISLNELGREYRVRFEADLLHMTPPSWEGSVARAKVAGLDRFRESGLRPFAVVDNEPVNIAAMSEADPDHDILFLHAETLFESRREPTPRTVSGSSYDITSLVSEHGLPHHVQLAWHGVNDMASLCRFLASPVRWGECDVRRDPHDRLVVRNESFAKTPWSRDEDLLTLAECLAQFKHAGKGIKLDLKDSGVVGRLLDQLDDVGFPSDQLWFNGYIDELGEAGFRRLARARPGAVIQCPVGFLAPLVNAVPDEGRRILEMLTGWGINRFSISWRVDSRRRLFERLEEWGYEVNFYNVPDLEGFLQAALLVPRSLTADFNFPGWHDGGQHAPKKRAREVLPTVGAT